MSKIKSVCFSLLAALVVMTMMLPTVCVEAAASYTVTYRAGAVGRFDTATLDGFETAGTGSIKSISYTANYVKVQVKAGSSKDVLADVETVVVNALEAQDGYQLLSASKWGYQTLSKSTITKDTEMVLDYGKLVNPAKYSIKYVNSDTQEQIAPSKIAFGEIGESVDYSLLTISGFTAASEAGSITLSEDESANQVVLEYDPVYTENVTTETEINYIYREEEEEGDDDTTQGGTTVTVIDTTGDDTGAGGAADDAGADDAADAADDTTTIEDEDTAANASLDDNANGENGETVIEDEESAAAAGLQGNTMVIVVGIICGLIIAAAIIYLMIRNAKREPVRNNNDSNDKMTGRGRQ
ncbi:MAG: hypothetical protein K5840_08330 [Eubacterium sp.]|nr:hypothetical protein [Eubacterium sp.]